MALVPPATYERSVNLLNNVSMNLRPDKYNEKQQLIKYPSTVMSSAGIILGVGSAIERGPDYVTPSLIGRAHTQNDPCKWQDHAA